MQQKRNEKIILILAIFAAVLLASSFYLFRVTETKIFDVKFFVGPDFGIDLDTSVVAFGMVVPGGSATRELKIDNSHPYPIRVSLFASSNINKFISADYNFTISPGESRLLPVTLFVPKETQEGEYDGKLTVSLYRA